MTSYVYVQCAPHVTMIFCSSKNNRVEYTTSQQNIHQCWFPVGTRSTAQHQPFAC